MRSRRAPQPGSNENCTDNGYRDNDLGPDDINSSLLSASEIPSTTPATTATKTTTTIDADNYNGNGDKFGTEKNNSGQSQQDNRSGADVPLPPHPSPAHSSHSVGHPTGVTISPHDDHSTDHSSRSPESPGDGVPVSPTSASPGHARYTVTPKDVVVTISPSGDKVLSQVVDGNSNRNHNNNEYSTDYTKGGLEVDAENEKVSGTKAGCALLRNKKLAIFFLLLVILLMVAAAVVVWIIFQETDTSSHVEEGTAWANETGRLIGKPELDGSTTLSTPVLTSTSPTTSLTTSSASTTATTPSQTTTMLTTSVFTLPLSYCNADHFACSMWGECLPLRFVCDGYPDCPNGRDENIGCECSPGQFRCANGQCVSGKAVCNGTYECIDRSDEANCPNCPIRCKSNGVCIWGVWHWCNGIFDCDDLSDETDCPERPGMRRCSNGVIVETTQFCDGVDHCGDNSDEDNCSACPQPDHIPCSGAGGRCIPAKWRCDGHQDCSGGEDEVHCANCTSNQFVCADYSCIDVSLRCDGKVDCAQSGGDEENCLSLSPDGLLLALSTSASPNSDQTRVPVCADGWSDDLGDQACALMGARSLHAWDVVRKDDISAALAVAGDVERSAPLLASLKRVSACKSNQVVQLSCKQLACGERKIEVMDSLVASGDLAPPGKWPWAASISYLGKPICGGVVIGHRWVLTAAHCIINAARNRAGVDFTRVPFYFTVKTGATNIYTSGGVKVTSTSTSPGLQKLRKPQTFRAANISLHPEIKEMSRGRYNWDLALIELNVTAGVSDSDRKPEGLEFNELVQPVCLPSQGEVFPRSSQCYIAGWGMINYYQYQSAHDLRDARMSVWSEAECRNAALYGESIRDTNSSICGGFLYSGAPIACKGDSGGPLMCLDPSSRRYKLAGIMSRGSADCSESRHSRVLFVRVSMATDWIEHFMKGS